MDEQDLRGILFEADIGIRERAGRYVTQLLEAPRYRMAFDAKIIDRSELEYLALFEKTRELIYQPGQNAIEEVITAFGIMAGTDGEMAYERVAAIESKVCDYLNTLQWYFGDYGLIPTGKHRM
jgi:hypothetical protein